MVKRMAVVVLAGAICTIGLVPVYATPPDERIAVCVFVNTASKDIETRMHSYIERELRRLGDVEISSEPAAADYTVRVLINPTQIASKDGNVVYAVSYMFTYNSDCGKDRVIAMAAGGGVAAIETFDDLKDVGEKMVAEFDAADLKAYRQAYFNKRAK